MWKEALLPSETHKEIQREFDFKSEAQRLSLDRMDTKENDVTMMPFFEAMFKNDIRFRIVVTLSKREAAGLREIARSVGISHKNLSKYLEELKQEGVIDTFQIGLRNKVYKIALRYDFVRKFL